MQLHYHIDRTDLAQTEVARLARYQPIQASYHHFRFEEAVAHCGHITHPVALAKALVDETPPSHAMRGRSASRDAERIPLQKMSFSYFTTSSCGADDTGSKRSVWTMPVSPRLMVRRRVPSTRIMCMKITIPASTTASLAW